ncbi:MULTISPECIES: hypothetical protein [unclassified Fibrobacter]|jgi:hypothetical protein|uniref:hypothetical protein n=1 Tax=unclassified Fibrobacter TaxID=2634177 RepID=UPI000BC68F15|nr:MULTISPECIES: hypothetical protein [unclassified Fibrobacter]MBO6135371.1 hypothetical protein [Fibrobacter sp.]MBQ9224866.1 hypothetical protein [Fibrobacter sp.]MBR2060169.1 hypothetical protein [Fibrobacter sp.]MBR2308591.1 hypothetical protein [Fibrobacter sp.]MBR4008595.1 hypothetical protein [Fibrobacter sp.]
MNFIKFCASSAALLFLCSCDSNEVSLAFNTENAPVQKYFLESSLDAMLPSDSGVTVPEAMETHLKVQATLSELVAYDNGSGRFEMKIDSVEYKSDKRTVEDYLYIQKYLLTQHFQYKMAPDGSVSEPAVEDVALQPGTEELNLLKLFMKVQPILPGTPTKVGTTWEREVQIPESGKTTSVYKSFTLEEVFMHDGAQMAKIGMNVKYREVADSSANVQMESKGFIVGTGSILFDMTHGVISTVNLDLQGHVNVTDLVAGSVIPDMHILQKIKLRGEF